MRIRRLVFIFLCLLIAAPLWAGSSTHVVRKGESLAGILARYTGQAAFFKRLVEANHLKPPYALQPGQKLIIPDMTLLADTAPPKTGSATATDAVRTQPPVPVVAAPMTIQEQRLAVISVEGAVELIRGTVFRQLRPEDHVLPGDSLRTRTDAYVVLSGLNGERITLDGSTSVLLRELSSGIADKRLVLRIDAGRVAFSAPESPFLTRYLFETPTGQLSMRHGELLLQVDPPVATAASVRRGRALAQVPRGEVELLAEQGAVLKTMDLPPAPQALPLPPGVRVEAAPNLAIVAAATRPEQTVLVEAFADPDRQRRVAAKQMPVDALGVALARLELPAGKYWFAVTVITADGLCGPAQPAGPLLIGGP